MRLLTSALPSLAALAAAAAVAAACGPGLDAPSITYPGMSAHDRYLPLAGTPHEPSASGPVTCEGCHTAVETFAQFTCTASACHAQPETDPIHAGMTGYAYASAACYGCHPSGTAAPANHPLLFPIGAGTAHAGIRCGECHTDFTRARDPASFACASCHQGREDVTAEHTVAGHLVLGTRTGENSAVTPVAQTSPNCLRCHADSQVNRVAAHPSDDEAFGRSEHRAAGCLTCHTQLRTDKPFGARWGSTGGCGTCHSGGGGD